MNSHPPDTQHENPSESIDGISERDQHLIGKQPATPSIPRNMGRLISNGGLAGTFIGIISCVTLSVLDQREFLPVIAPATLVLWVTWKIGKSIVRMHDQAEYEVTRNREIRDANQRAESSS